MAELEDVAKKDFLERLAQLMLDLRPELGATTSRNDLLLFGKKVVGEAQQIGFKTEFEVAVLCAALFKRGTAWYRDPQDHLYAIIRREGSSAYVRANRLLDVIDGPVALRSTEQLTHRF